MRKVKFVKSISRNLSYPCLTHKWNTAFCSECNWNTSNFNVALWTSARNTECTIIDIEILGSMVWVVTHLVSFNLTSVFSSVQSLSRVRLFVTPWVTAHQASLSITNSRSSLRFASIESVMPSSRLFQWVNSSHEVAKVLEFQL